MSRGKRELVDLTLHLHHETEKAWLVSNDGERDTAIWIPKSQVELGDRVNLRSQVFEFTMPEFLAYEKGLI